MNQRLSLPGPFPQALATALLLGAAYAPPVHGVPSSLQAETWISSCGSEDNVAHARPRLCNYSSQATRFQMTQAFE